MEDFFNEALRQELWILLDVVIASILTGIIGSERESSNKPAGFRTNMIVGGASALLVSVSPLLFHSYAKGQYPDLVETDPLRIIQAIVVGISFIGAGTILKSEQKERVQYLTSAATILLSAGVGIAVAMQKYVLGIGLTLLVYIINKVIKGLEKRWNKRIE